MAITIKGIKLNSFQIVRVEESGDYKIGTAEYSLISSADKVLAKQTIGGYGGLVMEPSMPTKAALDKFIALYVAEVNATLGLTE